MASAGHVRASGLSFRASLGSVIDGALEGEGRTHEIGPGIVAGVAVAKQWTFDRAWFVTGTLGFAASRTTTAEATGARVSLYATDFRAGVTAGRVFGPFSPYLLARGFAGPVFWTLDDTSVGGSDTHFFQLGAGARVTAGEWTVLVDVSALGETSGSIAMSVRL
jgi:hypothetical protein